MNEKTIIWTMELTEHEAQVIALWANKWGGEWTNAIVAAVNTALEKTQPKVE